MKIYITRKIPDPAVSLLEEVFEVSMWPEEDSCVPRDVLCAESRDSFGLLSMLTDKIDEELLKEAENLRIVSNMAVGYDNIDVGACSRRGIIVTNTPGVLTEATADLAFGLLLATARRIPEAQEYLKNGLWETWSPMLLTGLDVWGSTIGIVGMGRIGTAVARRAKGFNMRIVYYSRTRDLGVEEELGAEYRSLDSLLKEADFVTMHLPLTEQTKGLIGEKEIGLMKREAVLINTARGGIVDEDALAKALRDRKIWGAGLDVFSREPISVDSPFFGLDNVVLLPHIGSATVTTRTEMAVLAARNVREYLLSGIPITPVNPEALNETRM